MVSFSKGTYMTPEELELLRRYLASQPNLGPTATPALTPYQQIMSRMTPTANPYLPQDGFTRQGFMGGYNMDIFKKKTGPSGLLSTPLIPPSDGGGRDRDSNPNDFGNLSQAERAAYYAANPTMGKVTGLLQNLFGLTTLGAIQGRLNPGLVAQEGLISKGITPATLDRSLGNYSLGQPLGQDNSTGVVSGGTAGMGGGTGLSVDTSGGYSLGGPLGMSNSNTGMVSGSTEGMGGGTGLSAPLGDFGLTTGTTGAANMGGGTGLSLGGVNVGLTGTPAGLGFAVDRGTSNTSVGGGDGAGGDGGRVICTHFYKKGELNRETWRADMQFTFTRLSPCTIRGYQYWAIPYVKLMRKSKLAENIIRPLAFARAKELSYQMGVSPTGSVFGKAVRLVFEPICFAIGCFVGEQNWQSLWTEKKD